MVTDPVTCSPDNTLAEVDAMCARFRISGLPVTDELGTLLGIITNRDMRFEVDQSKAVREVMTKAPLITAQEGVSAEAALGRIGPGAKAAVPDLKPLLRDGKEGVRKTAAEAMKRIDPVAAKAEGIE